MTEVQYGEKVSHTRNRFAVAARVLGRVIIGVTVLASAWYLWISLEHFREIIVPTPAEVATDVTKNLGTYLGDTAHTLGFGILGSLLGLTLGASLAYSTLLLPWARSLVTAGSLAVRSIPILALTPAIAALFGYGSRGQLAVTGAISFFPAFVLITAAGRSIAPTMTETLTVFGASRPRLLALVVVPTTVPALLTAVRIAAANCVVSAVTAEFLISNNGLGRRLASAQVLLDSPRTWAIAIITVASSCALYSLICRVTEKTIQRFS